VVLELLLWEESLLISERQFRKRYKM